MTSFYDEEELSRLGLKSYGRNVKISRKTSIYTDSDIEIGNNVRIDDFCILSGKIHLGSNIHIAAYSALYGGDKGIFIGDFSNISSRVCLYSVSDDYSGETMTNPTIPDDYKNVTSQSVRIGKHVIVGSTSVILPGVTIEDGGSFGAFSLINMDTHAWTIYAGIPVKKIRDRKKDLLKLEQLYKEKEDSV